MRLTSNRFIAIGLIPTIIFCVVNRRNTNQNRTALEAAKEQHIREKQAQMEALRQAHEEAAAGKIGGHEENKY